MRIVFRADASLQIGTGHVMRCLALATALRQRGHECSFISRDLPGNLIDRTRTQGFATTALTAPQGMPDSTTGPAHAAWAGVSMAQDASETRTHLALAPDWLVLDHYAFDSRWENAARPPQTRLMVLDDLADRPHDCDLLVDQNLGRSTRDYDALLPPSAERLIGPAYALLRPEFAQARPGALVARARRAPVVRHLLIAMGGIDAQNCTTGLLDTLTRATPSGLAFVTVVLGAQAPGLDAAESALKALPISGELLVETKNMATLMQRADLAIGGAGGTALERCCLGLPSLIVIMADNQRRAACLMAAEGVSNTLADVSDLSNTSQMDFNLTSAFAALPAATLRAMQAKCAAVTDGKGTIRVMNALDTYRTGA